MRGSQRPSATRIVGVWLATLVGLVLWGVGPARAQDQSLWERNKGNCDAVLSTPQVHDLQTVRECAQRWESYGHPDAITRSEAQAYSRGLSRLHYQGTERDRSLADSALARLGLSVLPRGDFLPDERLETFLRRNQAPIRLVEADSRDARRARDLNSDGMREYNRGNYEAAARNFRQALEVDPFHLLAKYNLVCQLALLGETDEALRHLDELYRWDSAAADAQASHALTDADLTSLRNDVRFRLITGTARVQVLNGAGQPGVRRATAIRDALTGAGYDVASFGFDRYTRARPAVWHARGFEDAAAQVAGLVGDGAQVRSIDWPTDYDLVVVWGVAGEAGQLPGPLVQGYISIESGDPEEAVEETEDALIEAHEIIQDPEGAAQEWQPPF
jgi:tetratricopeptide (TPR) repeat protein